MSCLIHALRGVCAAITLVDDTPGLRPVGNTGVGRMRLTSEPVGVATLTLVGLQAGSDITILRAGSEEVLLNVEGIPGTTYQYVYPIFTTPTLADLSFYKPGYMPHTAIRGLLLSAAGGSLPITQTPDSSYLE